MGKRGPKAMQASCSSIKAARDFLTVSRPNIEERESLIHGAQKAQTSLLPLIKGESLRLKQAEAIADVLETLMAKLQHVDTWFLPPIAKQQFPAFQSSVRRYASFFRRTSEAWNKELKDPRKNSFLRQDDGQAFTIALFLMTSRNGYPLPEYRELAALAVLSNLEQPISQPVRAKAQEEKWRKRRETALRKFKQKSNPNR